MDTLSRILLESGLLDRETLAGALAQARSLDIPLQVHLVRSGLVDEGALVAALKQFVLVGQATSDELRAPQPQAIEAVPRPLAESFHLLPLRIDDQGHLVVAMSNPTDTHAVDELSYRTGLYVTRLVAPVGALETALAQWYRGAAAGSSTSPSIRRTTDATGPDPSAGLVLLTKVKRRPAAQPAAMQPTDVVPLTRIKRKAAVGSASPEESHSGAKLHASSPAVKPETARLLPSNGRSRGPASPHPGEDQGTGHWSLPNNEDTGHSGRKKRSTLLGLPTKAKTKKSRRKQKLSGWQAPGASSGLRSVAFDALRKELATCHDPNDVGRALVAYLHHWFGRTLFLVVRGQSIEGRFGEGLPPNTEPRHLTISLAQSSTLAHVVAARVPFQGSIPSHGQDGILTGFLGTNGPVLLVPILIRARVVALLCGALPDKPIAERELGDVVVLAESQYEKILAERKAAPKES